MKGDTEIRVLSEQDAAAFWKVRLRALQEEPDAFGGSYEESLETPLADVEKRLQGADSSFVLGAFSDAELVGTVGMFRTQGIKGRHKATIWGMYVAPEARGRGVAKALMVAAIERAGGIADLEDLMLSVVTTNDAAHKLYLALGFTQYGLERGALKIGDRYLDEYMMTLKL